MAARGAQPLASLSTPPFGFAPFFGGAVLALSWGRSPRTGLRKLLPTVAGIVGATTPVLFRRLAGGTRAA